MMPNTLSLPTVFAGIKRICDSEMVELQAASLRAAVAVGDMLGEAEKQLVSCARRAANAVTDDRAEDDAEAREGAVSELAACGREQALAIQAALEKHLGAEVQRLTPLAVTVDRLVEHLKQASQTSMTIRAHNFAPASVAAAPSEDESLLARLGRFRANLTQLGRTPESVAAVGAQSAFGVGVAAASLGVFYASHALLTEDDGARFEGDGERVRKALEGSGADRRKGLESYVRCVFGDLRREVYAALADARKSLDASGAAPVV